MVHGGRGGDPGGQDGDAGRAGRPRWDGVLELSCNRLVLQSDSEQHPCVIAACEGHPTGSRSCPGVSPLNFYRVECVLPARAHFPPSPGRGYLGGSLGRIYLAWCHPAVSSSASGRCHSGLLGQLMTRAGSKLGWSRDGAPMAGGDQAFEGQEEGKGCPHGSEHHPMPSNLLQRAGQPGATRGRALLVGWFRLSSKTQVWPCGWPRGAGEFQGGNKSQLLLKKDISCSGSLPGEGKGRCVVTAGRAEL